MSKPLLTIAVVNYNGLKYLPGFFANLAEMKFRDFELLFIDQSSTDGSADYVAKNHSSVKLLRNQNTGYTGGCNFGFEQSSSKYFMVWTVDVIQAPDYLSIAIDTLEKNNHLASFGGKILKYDYELQKKLPIIDSAGEQIDRARRVLDRGQGLEDHGQFNQQGEVFGISGQNPIYRRQALEAIKIDGRVWDESFFMYKEDIDVAWRLLLAGYKNYYNPQAVAWHVRGTKIAKRFSLFQQIKTRRQLSDFQKYYSLSNHTILIVKNELFSTFLRDGIFIIARLAAMYIFTLFTQPILFFKTLFRTLKMLPAALHARHQIMRKSKNTKAICDLFKS